MSAGAGGGAVGPPAPCVPALRVGRSWPDQVVWTGVGGGSLAVLPVVGVEWERIYLPVLGPGSVAMARQLGQLLAGERSRILGTDALGAELGLTRARTERVLGRLAMFRVIGRTEPGRAVARLVLPPLSGHLAGRLPPLARAVNDAVRAREAGR